ncbi:MAG: aldehyde dehydrogenase family protein [bacterium]|nr:aldehyde dehydrogenase family protein [bacterium]
MSNIEDLPVGTQVADGSVEARRIPDLEELPLFFPHLESGPGGGSGQVVALEDPSTGAPFARVALAGAEDVSRAVAAAATTASLWRSTPYSERARHLRRLAGLIYEQSDVIARLIAREQGKPRLEALTLEVLPALDHLTFLIDHAEQYNLGTEAEPRHPLYAHKHGHYLYDPLGVIALITPAPLPFALPLIEVSAALVMGNAVVLKPSERTPLCSLRIGELCLEAGLPPGLVTVIPAGPEEAIRLASHPKVDKVFFSGTVEAGQHVMATAGCIPRPVVLRLGGNHPSVVADDADIARAARGIVWGAIANCGQNCGAVERVYAEESIASRLLEHVLAEVDELAVGSPLAEQTDVGPLSSEAQRNVVHTQVLEATYRGGRLLRGGVVPEGPGNFYPPTVILGPPQDCALIREETLGPVIPLIVVENLERAILMANDSEHALTASGWTGSEAKAQRMMVGLQAGVVTINDVLYSFDEPAATWSGFHKSGLGQSHGAPGLREMCRQRFVSFDAKAAEGPLFAFPYDEATADMSRDVVRYLHAPKKGQRLRALFRLLRSRRFRARHPERMLTPRRRR